MTTDRYVELGHLFADFLEHGREILEGTTPAARGGSGTGPMEPVAITGAALGLPGTERVFDDHNVARLLGGEQLIDLIPTRFRHKILDKHITRLVKGDGGGRFESIDDPSDVLKLAGRAGHLDLVEEFGVDPERDRALDTVTRLAIGAGFDALRDAGIPLVQHYRLTSLGTQLPSRWGLPDSMRDDTGVIFASAFPGFDAFADELERHYTDQGRRHELEGLRSLRARVTDAEPVIPGLDLTVDFDFAASGYDLGTDNPLVHHLPSIYQSLGLAPRLDAFRSHSDGNLFYAAGTRPIILGPGALEVAHTPDEQVAFAEVCAAAGIYAALCLAADDLV